MIDNLPSPPLRSPPPQQEESMNSVQKTYRGVHNQTNKKERNTRRLNKTAKTSNLHKEEKLSRDREKNRVEKEAPEPAEPEQLKKAYEGLNCDDARYFSPACNRFLLKKEEYEREQWREQPDAHPYLYPHLNDPLFNVKIASKKEFHDTKYDGTIYEDIKKHADQIANADFELQPHQAFVKNFMSAQTPYSSLLLFHGLGSGKTCSAIGVCEEYRDFMRQTGFNKRIIIVASENVQNNFKLQLFDERKLRQINGVWTMKGCIGNKLLKEMNPMNMPMTKEKIISHAKTLINSYYVFMGYIQFANYIIKTMNYEEEIKRQRKERGKVGKRGRDNPREKTVIQLLKDQKIQINDRIIRRVRHEFDNRLLVIDEIHNIRKTEDNENKKVAIQLEYLVKITERMRLLFLSATPMYNNYREIIWLLNIMNMNDRRGRIEVRDVYDAHGNFKEGGEELFIRKATGYVSFVRGENPYTFPYRIYPNEFAPTRTFPHIEYPSYQMNLRKIKHEDKKRILSLYLTAMKTCDHCGKCQNCAYKYIIHNLRHKRFTITTKHGEVRDMPRFENMESFGYNLLQTPLEALIISYPVDGLREVLMKLPEDAYKEEFAPRFDEVDEIVEEREMDEAMGDEKEEGDENREDRENDNDNEIGTVSSHLSERKTAGEDDDSEEFIMTVKGKGGARKKAKKDDEQGLNASAIDETDKTLLSIDPHQLTGKIGLERMMQFLDSHSPPVKGEFEYKKQVLSKYGRIFSREHIPQYSAKIGSILNAIYDAEKDTVSEGVILIYSQYIDSGLIPMALALEEMGFTRFGKQGSTAKSLFKTRPTEVVDVRTMKPATDRSALKPARYALITGDSRLSPDNEYEVNGSTDEDNRDGHKVKVLLISKAGSEGIDFKYIRQVHILEPWYNMNRCEQIIGRAVRHLSHKLLPFEKRNVMIYMHATLLGNREEESADMYVYRVAEHKAIQIGKNTRILKESSVDCILNESQNQFTREMMKKYLKEPLHQVLSNGARLDNYMVGDAPFSPTCDYMATCNYRCRPNAEIEEDELNLDTYDEKFIQLNSDKIMQRIRMLFKEGFFYKKDTLLKSIRATKDYPFVQIYSALTQLIEDENEFLTDRYGRNGRLVNIGEYYLFQPIELKNKHVSLWERSVPLDVKQSEVDILLNPTEKEKAVAEATMSSLRASMPNMPTSALVKQIQTHPSIEQVMPTSPSSLRGKTKKLVQDLTDKWDMVKSFVHGDKQTEKEGGEKDWLYYSGAVIQKLASQYSATEEQWLSFVVAHLIEELLFADKRALMDYLYSLEQFPEGSFEHFARTYFDKRIISSPQYLVFLTYDLGKFKILILEPQSTEWDVATPEDMNDIARLPEVSKLFQMTDANDVVGFIAYEKGAKHLVFKTKRMNKSGTGARCDQAIKKDNMALLNEIVGENRYTNENTKAVKRGGIVVKDAVGKEELCVTMEFILRYFDDIREKDKRWFLSPEEAIRYKLYKVSV